MGEGWTLSLNKFSKLVLLYFHLKSSKHTISLLIILRSPVVRMLFHLIFKQSSSLCPNTDYWFLEFFYEIHNERFCWRSPDQSLYLILEESRKIAICKSFEWGSYKPLPKEKHQHFLILCKLLSNSLLLRGSSLFHGPVPKIQALLKNSSPVLDACVLRLHSSPFQIMPAIQKCLVVWTYIDSTI